MQRVSDTLVYSLVSPDVLGRNSQGQDQVWPRALLRFCMTSQWGVMNLTQNTNNIIQSPLGYSKQRHSVSLIVRMSSTWFDAEKGVMQSHCLHLCPHSRMAMHGGSLCEVLDGPLVVYVMEGTFGDLQADAECNTPKYSHQKQHPKNRSNNDTRQPIRSCMQESRFIQ